MGNHDARWMQRLQNYERAFAALAEMVQLAGDGPLGKMERSALIMHFVLVYELAWKLIQDYCIYQGDPEVKGSRDAFRAASKMGLVQQGDVLMKSMDSRNDAVHAYDEELAEKLAGDIVRLYCSAFEELLQAMQAEHKRMERQ